MKITKRQLKRIIREEYSRLKRKGLIKENMNDLISAAEDYIDQGGNYDDTMEEYFEWAHDKGYDSGDAEEAWERATGR